MDDIFERIGKNLKSLRKERNVSQKELAEALNVSQTSVALWETGKRKPSLETIMQISTFFAVPCDFLYSENLQNDKKTVNELIKERYKTISNNSTDNDINETRQIAQKLLEIPELRELTRQIAQKLLESPEFLDLVRTAKDIPPEQLKAHTEFMKSLKRQEKGDYDEPC